jgi:hypothetical protein
MQAEGYVEAIRDDLARVAALGDEPTARAADLIAVALEASVRRRLQEAVTEAALELTGQLPHGRVEVRLVGGDPELVYVDDPPGNTHGVAEEALSARLTLRLPESLKSRVESVAAADGVSVNTWVVQALSRVLERRPSAGSGRRRLTGFGRN